MTHGGFTCAEADEGTQQMAATISRLRTEREAALRAYDTEVIGRRDEVTRLLTDLGRVRAELAQAKAAVDPAERKALDALHVWLHHPQGDCDLIEACADFHQKCSHGECQVAEFAVAKDIGPEELDRCLRFERSQPRTEGSR